MLRGVAFGLRPLATLSGCKGSNIHVLTKEIKLIIGPDSPEVAIEIVDLSANEGNVEFRRFIANFPSL